MRRRFAIPLIVVAGATPWFWLKPPPPAPDLPAQFLSSIAPDRIQDWFGGLSGIEVSDTGETVHIITDRGHILRGTFERSNDQITGMTVTDMLPFLDENGNTRPARFVDAEGVAIDRDGRVFVSFEQEHHILMYPEWGGAAEWPSYTRSWRALTSNGGLEALAIDLDGTLFTLPEKIAYGAYEALVYRRRPDQPWEQPFTIPVDAWFAPVGADFGPDGRLYLLERGIYPFGFYSRVRAMDVSEEGVENITTVLETRLGQFGNLEGISVWADDNGNIRLTMVSDDNFMWLLPGQIVEYVMPRGVAQVAQPD